jgi:hypothetical protein
MNLKSITRFFRSICAEKEGRRGPVYNECATENEIERR